MEEYIKFAEGLRTFKLLKPETIAYMTRDWLTEEQKKTFPQIAFHYGLGVRSRESDPVMADFGWGGAAGATLHVDIRNGVSVYYSQHLLLSPNQGIRTRVYSAVMEDLGYDVRAELPMDPNANNLTY